MATMGDLIGFKGYLNSSAPFKPKEMPVVYKTGRHYHDWGFTEDYNESCNHFPRLYMDNGEEVGKSVYGLFSGCYNSDFDQVQSLSLQQMVPSIVLCSNQWCLVW